MTKKFGSNAIPLNLIPEWSARSDVNTVATGQLLRVIPGPKGAICGTLSNSIIILQLALVLIQLPCKLLTPSHKNCLFAVPGQRHRNGVSPSRDFGDPGSILCIYPACSGVRAAPLPTSACYIVVENVCTNLCVHASVSS